MISVPGEHLNHDFGTRIMISVPGEHLNHDFGTRIMISVPESWFRYLENAWIILIAAPWGQGVGNLKCRYVGNIFSIHAVCNHDYGLHYGLECCCGSNTLLESIALWCTWPTYYRTCLLRTPLRCDVLTWEVTERSSWTEWTNLKLKLV
jgi:hypothetical protein